MSDDVRGAWARWGGVIVRATKKFAQRLGGFDPVPTEPDLPLLGEWYATVIFWRPQVALFVSETTLLPYSYRLHRRHP